MWVKTINNPQGPHALVSELIGFELANWLRLRVPKFLVHDFEEQSQIIVMADGRRGKPGPAFVSFEIDVREWDGTANDLAQNAENNWDVVGLIILDTWLRNIDRYAPFRQPPRRNIANVFLGVTEREGTGKRQLVALDHSEALREGGGELHKNHFNIDRIRDVRVYGMFPEFVQLIATEHRQRFIQRLASFGKAQANHLVNEIPAAWEVGPELRESIASFLCERAQFLCTHAGDAIVGAPKQLGLFDLTEGSGHG